LLQPVRSLPEVSTAMTSETPASLRARNSFLASLGQGDTLNAIQAARAVLREEYGLRAWNFIAGALKKTALDKLDLKPFRVALLSSFSIEFIHSPLLAFGFLNGLSVQIYQAGFGQYRQEILDPVSGLYAFHPDAVVLALEGRDLLPHLYREYLEQPPAAAASIAKQVGDEIAGLVSSFRSRSSAPLLIHDFAPPTWPSLGIAEGTTEFGQIKEIQNFNHALRLLGRENPSVYVVDYEGLVARHGVQSWYDERMALYAGAPIAQVMMGPLVSEYMKYFRALTGRSKKCLVLDLDNTLWGGVLGEDGMSGIALGPNYPGSAFVAFQHAILSLHRRGILLALASKNNLDEVERVFASHPGMVLKKEHFSSIHVNWGPKSSSVRQIAGQLNIGLDHIVVADDNPVECEEIVGQLPMVTAICLPKQPEKYVEALLQEGLFDTLSLSAEDQSRGALYQQRAQAEAMRASTGSIEGFYRSLEMEVTFAPVSGSSLSRAAQLTQKTNQFNVTTIRRSEAELTALLADPDWMLTTVAVRDRFGDNGIVGLLFARIHSGAVEIDTFLLSCRVIGRTVETAMLARLCDEARRRSATVLRGRVVPTLKNLPSRDVFEKHGFTKLGNSNTEASHWILDLAKDNIAFPEWIRSAQTQSGESSLRATCTTDA
jgi:FkbH-like protein